MATSPTQRSLKYLRDQGYDVDKTEQTIPKSFIKRDLFGFCDIQAINDKETLYVQTTTAGNQAARIKKIAALPVAHRIVAGPNRRIIVHGWSKRGARGKRKTWQVTVTEWPTGREAKP